MTSTAFDRITDALSARGSRIRFNRNKAEAQCPGHDDDDPSLCLTGIEGQTLAYCQAGCETVDVMSALGLTMADLFDTPKQVTYKYANGGLVHRYPSEGTKKTFKQFNFGKVKPLYRLERLPDATDPVFLVEGEKDVHAIESVGGVATTGPGGAGNFGKVDVSPLRGKNVIAVVDRDDAGAAWAVLVQQKLTGVARTVQFVQASVGKDAADHIAAAEAGQELVGWVPYEPPGSPPEPARRIVSANAAKMKMKPTRWLYQGRMPAGAITLLAGREGIGKSTIGFDLAAQLTRGELPGRYFGQPQNVAIIASEDSWECVILPRLVAARADLSRVERFEAMTESGELDTISAPNDLVRLRAVCEEKCIRLIIIDPVMSVISGVLDTHKDREVRQALDPLSRFAAESGVAILGLIHVNKSSTTDPLNSIMASRAFTAVARSVLYCILDPEAEQEDRYLFGHPKCNVGPKMGTIGYRLVECRIDLDPADVEEGDESEVVTSMVAWGAGDARSIRDAMESPPAERAKGELNLKVLAWVVAAGRVVARSEIAEEFSDVKSPTLDSTLSRMVKAGQLSRPHAGHYKAVVG